MEKSNTIYRKKADRMKAVYEVATDKKPRPTHLYNLPAKREQALVQFMEHAYEQYETAHNGTEKFSDVQADLMNDVKESKDTSLHEEFVNVLFGVPPQIQRERARDKWHSFSYREKQHMYSDDVAFMQECVDFLVGHVKNEKVLQSYWNIIERAYRMDQADPFFRRLMAGVRRNAGMVRFFTDNFMKRSDVCYPKGFLDWKYNIDMMAVLPAKWTGLASKKNEGIGKLYQDLKLDKDVIMFIQLKGISKKDREDFDVNHYYYQQQNYMFIREFDGSSYDPRAQDPFDVQKEEDVNHEAVTKSFQRMSDWWVKHAVYAERNLNFNPDTTRVLLIHSKTPPYLFNRQDCKIKDDDVIFTMKDKLLTALQGKG